MENVENEKRGDGRYVVRLTLQMAVWTLVTSAAYALITPTHYLTVYPAIPIFLYVLSLMAYRATRFFEMQGSANLVMVYLVVKMLKLFLSVIGLLIYCLAASDGLKEFVIAFLVNYVFFLTLETSQLVTFQGKKQ
jgi:hypothetical protein